MNDREAKNLLDETFNKEFNLSKFNNFLSELFNGFYPQPRSLLAHKEYEKHIVSITKLGNYKQNNKSMEILVVKLKKGTSLDKARTMQRNVVAKLLKKFNIDSALVAFISGDFQDWRFSFVKMDYKFTEEGGISEELTPAKRYSFLVGPNEPNHTCRSQFIELIKNEDQKPSIDEIENAFSIEKVTKEFFEKYKNLYHNLREDLNQLVSKDKNLKEEFENKQISPIDFAKKLLGQIVFLYFLQKKGWLGVKKGESGKFENWGSGSRRFIQNLFYKAKEEKKNFFNDYLEPLFYHALATDRRADGDYYEKFNCKIPFLNGGLFEPLNGYNWGETDINLDNNLFEEIFKTFDEFNFTIKEDEPLEKEVAVDPEMLGKVFENLLDVDDRKSKGAFYTPREIVHYMCQQSLINYLETNIKVPREDLEFFIQKGDLALEYLRREDVGKLKSSEKDFLLPDSIKKGAKELDKLLIDIKICDPAVGSGAFPVGMMNEIIKARMILSYLLSKSKTDYELKRETIENSLYGVDIEPSAVEITKLRFWLSLIVDEEDMNNIKPLPNLENKIMCGNSLIEEFEGIKLYMDPQEIKERKDRQMTLDQSIDKKIKKSEQKLKELRKKQKEFFDVENRTQKNELKEEIDRIEWEFIEETLREQGDGENMKKLEQYKKNKSKPFFLWNLYFSDVFHRDNPGFDVVIGNPPYVDYRQIPRDTIEGTREFEVNFKSKRPNLYYFFVEKGFKLLKESGFLTFINPNQFLSIDSAYGLRNFLLNKTVINFIIDVSYIKVFSEAATYTSVWAFSKNKINDYHISVLRCADLSKLDDRDFSISKKEIIGEKELRITINPDYETINKMLKNSEHLGKIGTMKWGTSKTGYGKIKILHKKYETLAESEKTKYEKIIQTRDIKEYHINWHKEYIPKEIYSGSITRDFDKEKIVIARVTKKPQVALDNKKYFVGKSTILVDIKENKKYLLAILNSKLIQYWYYSNFETTHMSGGYIRYDIPYLKQIPIKKTTKEQQKPLIEIVDKILSITENEDYQENSEKKAKVKAYQKQIDRLVYGLYELTPEEIDIVEEFGK